MTEVKPATIVDKFQAVIDKTLPSDGPKCPLSQCTAGSLYFVLAALSTLGAAFSGSWKVFLANAAWHVIMVFVFAWLCRSCHTSWAWFIFFILAVLPIIIFLAAMLMFYSMVN